MDLLDSVEQYRLNKISYLKQRSKGAPEKTKKDDIASKKGKSKK